MTSRSPSSDLPRLPVVFYRTAAGAEVVRDWFKSLPDDDRAVLGQDLMRVQYRWPVGMPLCRAMGGGLWEVRSSLSRGRIARVLFCVADGRIVVLTGFIKKTRTTPKGELDLARQQQREFEDGQDV